MADYKCGGRGVMGDPGWEPQDDIRYLAVVRAAPVNGGPYGKDFSRNKNSFKCRDIRTK